MNEWDIQRTTHVVFSPYTELWEVWELTPSEAFDLDQEYYGVGVAIENMNYDSDELDDQEKSCTT